MTDTPTCHRCLAASEGQDHDRECGICAAGPLTARGTRNLDFPQACENAYDVSVTVRTGEGDKSRETKLEYVLYAEGPEQAAGYAGQVLTSDHFWMKRGVRPLTATVTRGSDGETHEYHATYEGKAFHWEEKA